MESGMAARGEGGKGKGKLRKRERERGGRTLERVSMTWQQIVESRKRESTAKCILETNKQGFLDLEFRDNSNDPGLTSAPESFPRRSIVIPEVLIFSGRRLHRGA